MIRICSSNPVANQEEEVYMKKLLSVLMVAVFALSLTVPAFAANSSVKKKTNSEFEYQ